MEVYCIVAILKVLIHFLLVLASVFLITNIDKGIVVADSGTWSFSLMKYTQALRVQIQDYLLGQIGYLTYNSNLDRSYSLNSMIGEMILHSLSYLLPGLALSIFLGLTLGFMASYSIRMGRLLDAGHKILLSVPDFLLVVILQYLGILLAKLQGHNVILIMQFGSEIPYLIPFLTISIIPSLHLYGVFRIACEREWQNRYVLTAYSKGLNRTSVLFVHILRNTAEDVLAVLPRIVSISVSSMVIAEMITGIFGIGGYAVNPRLYNVTTLPATCSILASILFAVHLLGKLFVKYLPGREKERIS
jgi:oligopeptide transport system permease protein